jgi:hypothetical protein
MSPDRQSHGLHPAARVIRLSRSSLLIRSLSPALRGSAPKYRHFPLSASGMIAEKCAMQAPSRRLAKDYHRHSTCLAIRMSIQYDYETRQQSGITEMRDSRGFEMPFGCAGSPAYWGTGPSADHIRYSAKSGFSGITPQDKEQWIRKYPHVSDFELAVAEGHEWVSRYWDKARRAEERPREFLDWWLAGEWIPVSGYKEPDTIYNPEQLSDFIEQYFKTGELIGRMTRGKHDGSSEAVASKHYEQALGHAVKLRSVAPEFPKAPDTIGRPHIDLRRLQEWCVECGEISRGLYTRVRTEDIENILRLLRELDDHLKAGFPQADGAALAEIYRQVRREIEKLLKAVEELDEADKTFCIVPSDSLESKMKHWLNVVTWDQAPKPLVEKMQQLEIPIPSDKAELIETLGAAQWMAKTDWNKVREITEEKKDSQPLRTPIDKLTEQMRILEPAKITEEKIGALAYKRYCRENPDYDKALREAQERMESLYNGAADAINSQQDLAKIVYLRNSKLESAFKRVHDALFGTSFYKSTPDEPLQDAVEELEAICEIVKCAPLVTSRKPLARPTNRDIAALLAGGESKTVEFKSSARWDMKENRANKVLEQVSVKTVAAFLNTEGGTLFIGVDDTGTPIGLADDLKTLGKKQDCDGYENWLTTLLLSAFGKEKTACFEVAFHSLQGKDVCVVNAEASPGPVYVREDNAENLYIRTGNSTRLLTSREAVEYVRQHWN